MRVISMQSFDKKQWSACYELYERIYQESYPYRELPSLETFLKDPKPLNAMTTPGLLGFVVCDREDWFGCCHYKVNADQKVLTAEVKFLQASFDKAVADAVVKELRVISQEHGVDVIQLVAESTTVRDHFVGSGAFRKAGMVRESVLDILQLDRTQQEDWLRIGSTYALKKVDWDDEKAAQEAVDLHNEGMEDVPFQDTVHVPKKETRSSFLEFRDGMRNRGNDLLTYGLYDRETLVGLSMYEHSRERPRTFYIHYTGIRRTHRKLGLGKALKALTLEQLKREFPEARYIVTGNEETNAPMLRINLAMGFRTCSELTMLRYQDKL